jgi:S1-C subfamily serine protease
LRRRLSALVLSAAASTLAGNGCAGPRSAPAPAAAPAAGIDSPVPGTIGAAVRADAKRVVVSDVGEPARSAGLLAGDVVVAYNGVQITDVLQFERLVLESDPGSRASVQVLRNGALRVIEVPVQQIRTGTRA